MRTKQIVKFGKDTSRIFSHAPENEMYILNQLY